ncbi:helix-turn-helix domain-containing protein [Streptomyces sp. RB110-1]|uniref:helix-turn-helix domain-containing protein n=1 Tax=unclassified Streptomyces TaxID=2593676 RepID=UPI001901624C|nr:MULTISPECIES: helix-turn-helix transcriptional regulator [unclassified Streptomyces]MBK0372938.1 helix-turn-helix domain-containing protein [Streptomyces sp. RB110-1]MBK0390694.1 helix-turn-helix domain-containing protein [Streptomyces sp. RB110-2]
MGQQPNDLTPGAGPWHRWGYELRQFREARRLSQQALAHKALIDRSHLGRFERAERPVPRPAAVVLDEVLDAAGALVRCWDEAEREAPQDGSAMTSRAEKEVDGANSRSHEASGLRPLAESRLGQAVSLEDDTDLVVVPARIHGRIRFVPVPRRVVLASGLAGLATTAIPATTATANTELATMGSPFEHFAQLRRVIIQTDNLIGPRHVLPALQQHLVSLAARRRDARGIDAVELLALETRYEELAGWFAQDIGDERAAHGHTAKALDASHVTGDADLTAYILARKAQLAVDTGHPADALGLATAARRTARPGSRLEVIAVLHEAHSHAVLGEGSETHKAYDTALTLLGRADSDGVWGSWLDAAYVNTARARSLAALGDYERAAAGFDNAIAMLPPTYRRDRGVYLARAARAHAGTGNMPLAARIGAQAVGIAAETGSARIFHQLDRLDQALAPAAGEDDVAEFRASLDRIVLHPA